MNDYQENLFLGPFVGSLMLTVVFAYHGIDMTWFAILETLAMLLGVIATVMHNRAVYQARLND